MSILTKNERKVLAAVNSGYYHYMVPYTVRTIQELTKMSPRAIRTALRGLWIKKQVQIISMGIYTVRPMPENVNYSRGYAYV